MLKVKNLTLIFLGALTLLNSSIEKNVRAKASDNYENISYAVTGNFIRPNSEESQDWNLYNPQWFYPDNNNHRHGVTLDLKAGDEFKILWREQGEYEWSLDNSFGYNDSYVSAEVQKYFTKADDSTNFKVKVDGKYELFMSDEATMPYESRFGVENIIYHNCNFYFPQFKETLKDILENEDGLVETKENLIQGHEFYPDFFEYDEKEFSEMGINMSGRFEAWYTDENFENLFPMGSIIGEEDINLYGKFDDSTDYTFYINDTNSVFGAGPYVYFSRAYDGNVKDSWPGEALTKNENGYYEITVDVSRGYDMIIINDGTTDKDTAIQSVQFDVKTASNQEVYLIGSQNEDKTYNIIVPEYALINYYDGEKLLGSEKKLKNINVQPTFFEKEGYRLLGWYLEPTLETLYTNGKITEDSLNLYAKYEEAEDFEIYVAFLDERWVENGVTIHRWSSNFDNPNATDINNIPVDTIKITDYYYKFIVDASKSFDRMQFKIADTFTKTIYLDDYISGTYNPYSQTGELLDCLFFPRTILAHIKGETLELSAYNATVEGVPYLGLGVEATAIETGVSILTLEIETVTFNTAGITEEQRKNAVIAYFKDREAGYWCDKSANYLEYQILANGYENEMIDEEAGTTIGDRVNYLTALAQKTNNNSQSARFNNASITNNNVSFVILVVVLGFISIIGYYFFNKRKLEI